MSRIVRRRLDGLVEIRRARWTDAPVTRDLCSMAALLVAWAVSVALLVAALVEEPLVAATIFAAAASALVAVGVDRAVAQTPAPATTGGRPLPPRAA